MFTQLSRSATAMVAVSMSCISKFVYHPFKNMVKECKTTIFVKDIDILLMVYAQIIEEEKERESKGPRMGSLNFSQ